MPQMMPLLWMLLLCYSIILLIIVISFTFFFSLPPQSIFIMPFSKLMNNSSNNKIWIWLW